tara:strand:+ start:315 stop:530 length:216 start_codon:yes stop_codon:yes gene_type:complete
VDHTPAEMLLPGGASLRRHVREGRGKVNAWLPVRLLVVAALGNIGNRMLHLLLPAQPQVYYAWRRHWLGLG